MKLNRIFEKNTAEHQAGAKILSNELLIYSGDIYLHNFDKYVIYFGPVHFRINFLSFDTFIDLHFEDYR